MPQSLLSGLFGAWQTHKEIEIKIHHYFPLLFFPFLGTQTKAKRKCAEEKHAFIVPILA
jgi:hypothetical protein